MIRRAIGLVNGVQTDLDEIGVAKTARDEKRRARDEKKVIEKTPEDPRQEILIALAGLIAVSLVYQLLANLKVVGANELAVVAGKGRSGFSTLRGGRVFIWPLIVPPRCGPRPRDRLPSGRRP